MTEIQIAALKYLIAKSKDASELSKQVMFYLIDQSEGFSKEVAISFSGRTGDYSNEEAMDIVFGVHDMESSNGSTHLDALMKLSGCVFTFSQHGGHYKKGIFNARTTGGTVWLSKNNYGHNTNELIILPTPKKDEIQKINLKKNGLYKYE